MKSERWVLKNKKADFEALTSKYNISEVLARLITNRDILDENDIDLFLEPDLKYLHNPSLMKDLDKACEIIEGKILQGKKIRIVGDYDVDGVASTYILYHALSALHAQVDYEIPDRIKDGYGINLNIIEAAAADGIDTIITCDNGISATTQVKKGKELGMTVIITDHHDIPYVMEEEQKIYVLPEGDAVVNMKQMDCNYPFESLCGAGVAFKLIQVIFEKFNKPEYEALAYLEIAAIATICDVMDLKNENRVIVRKGIEMLKNTSNLGLRALFEVNNIPLNNIAAYHLGFIIGPCLNASGRLQTAKIGLKLLLSNSREEATKLARELKGLNDTRKDMTVKGLEQAIELVESTKLKEDKILVVYLKDCHESLAGIIAGRLKERYNKPAIVLTDSENGIKGSARSIEACNIYEELTGCKTYLLKFGGHPMAAGMSLETINLEDFRRSLNEHTNLTTEDLIPKISIDILLPFGYLNEELVIELKRMEPFGKGNPKPLFGEKNLLVNKAIILGKNANVLKLTLTNTYGRTIDCMYFGDTNEFISGISETYGEEESNKIFQNRENKVRLSITYYPDINEYNGKRTLQAVIQNYMFQKEDTK
ncbi:MAG: recJ2 [Anaerocolumna sp.]|jgi:single-stranded-DNA-specific exonuclease|nr:recJ2 [Anaerocolumna sp.]